MNINPFALAKRINRPLILDGAIGSLLEQKGLTVKDSLWSAKAIIKSPEQVISIHRAYIKAGADIITSNTFRTNPYSLKLAGINAHNSYVKKAVKLAKDSIQSEAILLAGSNAPAEDCYQKKRTISKKVLEWNHKYHIDSLIDSGCDFILNETQSHFDEIKIICEHCKKNKIPFVLSLFFNTKSELLSGEKISDIISYILNSNPLAIGFNCVSSEVFEKVFKKLKRNLNWGVYLNCGSTEYKSGNIKCNLTPFKLVNKVEKYLMKNPAFIGSCCGSTPLHTKSLKNFIDGKINT